MIFNHISILITWCVVAETSSLQLDILMLLAHMHRSFQCKPVPDSCDGDKYE